MAIALQAATPARSDRAVVFACDGTYARFALLAADQIARLHPDRDFDICLCAPDEDLEPVGSLTGLGLRFCHVATGGLFRGLHLDARRSEATYLRLALPEAFGDQYRRLLYLDSDVFVQGGDFDALLAADLGGCAVGAVRDNTQWRTPDRHAKEFRRLGLPAMPYLNGGVLLVDVAAYRGQRVLERCGAVGRDHPEALTSNDQSMLNLALRGDWAELSPAWNWQYTRASMLFEAMETAHVVHFIGPKKPWSHKGGALPLKFRRAYRDFFAAHFPEAPPIGDDGLAPHQNRDYLRRMLMRHLLAVGRFCDHLDRFPSDLTVLTPR